MNENNSMTKNLPLIAAVVGGLLLGAVAVYIFSGGFGAGGSAERSASSANADADAAIAAAGISDTERAATEAIIRAYILDNPEIIPEAVELLQQKQTAERLGNAGDALDTPFPGAQAGNPQGDVTVVKFTDYNCGYCRASMAEVDKLIANDKNVRVVYREMPILAETSKTAALWALAAAKQGKYMQFHEGLFNAGRPTETNIAQVAEQIGLNVAAAQDTITSDEAVQELRQNQAQMQELGFNGTPTFVIGDQLLEGMQQYDALQAAVDKARAG